MNFLANPINKPPLYHNFLISGFPDGLVIKNPPAKAEMKLISGLGRSPGVRKRQPASVFPPGNPWTEEPDRQQVTAAKDMA